MDNDSYQRELYATENIKLAPAVDQPVSVLYSSQFTIQTQTPVLHNQSPDELYILGKVLYGFRIPLGSSSFFILCINRTVAADLE